MMNPYWSSVLPLLSRACSTASTPSLELLATAGATRTRGTVRGADQSLRAGGVLGNRPRNNSWSDAAKFVIEWLRHPHDTAAIAPSGQALASLITGEIDDTSGPVLELGPGTGVFTRALTRRGVAERDLTLVEQSPPFASLLKRRFPTSTILNIDAAQLHRSRQPATQPFGAVVCGLGFRGMDPSQIEDIVRGSFTVLRPAAAFYLFTYGNRCSVPDHVLNRLGLSAEKVGSTLRNRPPASVYRLRRTTVR